MVEYGNKIQKNTFICGFPVAQSRSPLIHNYWLKLHHIDGLYEPMAISPDELANFIATIKQSRFRGGNFTLPHKEAAFTLVDRLDDAAKAIGALNTLLLENDQLVGANTDAYGFAANLDDQMPQWRKSETALVVGAGGASRAVLYALIKAGIKKIDLINRTFERAKNLEKAFPPFVTAYAWGDASSIIARADLIVNCTSIGMGSDDRFPFELSTAKPTALASDIVYTPLKTAFLKEANEAGLKTSDGLGMLLHQAVPGFEKWYGVRPIVDHKLRNIILNDIGRGKTP